MPKPLKVTIESRLLLRRVATVRMLMPSNKELARQCGVSERTVEEYIKRFMGISTDSRETNAGMMSRVDEAYAELTSAHGPTSS